MLDFFTHEEFELLGELSGQKRQNSKEHDYGYEVLRNAYDKLGYWLMKVQSETMNEGKTSIVRRPTNQANIFDGYLWAQLYPNANYKKYRKVAFTLGLNGHHGFDVKIDTIHLKDGDPIRKHYLKKRGDFSNSTLVKILSFDKASNWPDLIDFGVQSIIALQDEYNQLISEIIEFDPDAKQLTNTSTNSTEMKIITKFKNWMKSNWTSASEVSHGYYAESVLGFIEMGFHNKNKLNSLEHKELWRLAHDLRANGTKGGIPFKAFVDSITASSHNQINIPLNQILYGPPGTGKTYHTIRMAVEIANPKFDLEQDWDELKKEYDRLINEGQIVLTTFHQSMTYEDFVEGIKPLEPEKEGDQVIYKVVDGIFKSLCKEAESTIKSKNFDLAFTDLIREILDQEDEKIELKTPRGSTFWIGVNRNNNLNLFTGQEAVKQGSFTQENLIKQINGERMFLGWEGYSGAIIDHLRNQHGFETNRKNKENYVLIVDEINRGNVSAIFGELITLIEKPKRAGHAEELRVVLPYSKEPFSVPDNLYILGTMNTADRSVEALDTALRRRFSFQEMSPKPELLASDKLLWLFWEKDWNYRWDDEKWLRHEESLLNLLDGTVNNKDAYYKLEKLPWNEGLQRNVFDGIVEFKGLQLDKLLITINQRIELLLDKDHMIGHSYFLSLVGAENCKMELVSIFYDKIIPLLQEYFYGDFGKIGLILGKDFVSKKEGTNVQFADFDLEDQSLYQEKRLYGIQTFDNIDEFIKAVKRIYEEAVVSESDE